MKECQGVNNYSKLPETTLLSSKAVGFMPQMALTNLVAKAQRGTCSVHVHDAEVHKSVTNSSLCVWIHYYESIMHI